MITAGIDMGAKFIKVIILEDGKIIGRGIALTGFEQAKSAEEAFQKALKDAGIKRENIKRILATGVGMEVAPYKDAVISIEGAAAKGGWYLFNGSRTIIDVGAEEGRAVRCDEKGNLVDFVVNERCAAGAGTFVEAMARALEVSLEEMGPLAMKSKKAVPMNAQCTVFAESEVVTLIHSGVSKEDISRAIHDAIAERIVSMSRRLGIVEEVTLAGGLANDIAYVDAMKRLLKLDVNVPEKPEFVGALGAAIIAAEQAGGM